VRELKTASISSWK